jgi:hypothetical protein
MERNEMSVSLGQKRTTLRYSLERAAGMHTAPVAGTTALLFGACDAEAHGRCPERTTVGARVLGCSCPCHAEQAADFDARYGEPWWAAQSEAE